MICSSALLGIANVLVHIAPLYLMCDPMDIRVVPQVKAVHTKLPTIYFYDRYPGGIGLSERLFEVHDELLKQAQVTYRGCTCLSGCPACVGPIEEVGLLGKVSWQLDLIEARRCRHERACENGCCESRGCAARNELERVCRISRQNRRYRKVMLASWSRRILTEQQESSERLPQPLSRGNDDARGASHSQWKEFGVQLMQTYEGYFLDPQRSVYPQIASTWPS